MKKFLFILSALAVFASCQKEDTGFDGAPADIYAAIGDSGTKATFGTISTSETTISYPHVWEQTDDISVFWENTTNMLYRNASTGGSEHDGYSRFMQSGYADAKKGEGPCKGTYAIYPYDDDNTVSEVDGNAIYKFIVPSEQIYRVGTYGKASTSTGTYGCAVFIGRHDGGTANQNYFNFYNTGCFLKLPVKAKESGVKVTKVVLKSNNAKMIAGSATASVSMTAFSRDAISISGGTSDTIELTSSDGVSLATDKATDFYIFLLPTTFASGFTVSFYDGDTLKAVAVTNSSLVDVFKRNYVVCMKPIEINPAKIQLTVTVDSWGNGGSSDINLE